MMGIPDQCFHQSLQRLGEPAQPGLLVFNPGAGEVLVNQVHGQVPAISLALPVMPWSSAALKLLGFGTRRILKQTFFVLVLGAQARIGEVSIASQLATLSSRNKGPPVSHAVALALCTPRRGLIFASVVIVCLFGAGMHYICLHYSSWEKSAWDALRLPEPIKDEHGDMRVLPLLTGFSSSPCLEGSP